MSDLQEMGESSGNQNPQGRSVLPQVRMRRSSQVQHKGNSPFLYSYRDGCCVVNAAPRQSAYAQAKELGDALI